MSEIITLERAHLLFMEAYLWSSGRVKFMDEHSEIRAIAKHVFHQENISVLQQVCNEIFYVIACASMDVER